MLGTSLILGVDESPLHALVQGKGPALRIETAPFLLELEQSPALQYLLKRYLLCGDEMGQLAQTAAWRLLPAAVTRPIKQQATPG